MRVPLRFDSPLNRPHADANDRIRDLLERRELHTVCQEASCPNLRHCWSRGTATFMILGDRCTRRCAFCDIKTARPFPPDPEEPLRVAGAVREMKLRHAVVTSVTRDDLPDGGSSHFVQTVHEIRRLNPETTIELLVPDFRGSQEDLERVLEARPDVLNHNLETVPSLYRSICPGSHYERSLELLARAAERARGELETKRSQSAPGTNSGAETLSRTMHTKSGLLLGLGESLEEVLQVMGDLRSAGVEILTLGQYLAPSGKHAPVVRTLLPEEFDTLRQRGLEMGFLRVEAGTLVRSSYHADDSLKKVSSIDRGEPS